EDTNHIAGISRIAVFKGLAGRGLHPLSVNKVLVNFGTARGTHDGRSGKDVCCHKLLPAKQSMLQARRKGGKRATHAAHAVVKALAWQTAPTVHAESRAS